MVYQEIEYNMYLVQRLWLLLAFLAFSLNQANALTTFIENNGNNSAQDLADDTWQILSHRWESSSGDVLINQNGNQIYSAIFQQGYSIETGGTFIIGNEQNSLGQYAQEHNFIGDIAEIIMFNSSVNQARTRIIENYLSAKYGLALSSNDKYTGNNIAYIHQAFLTHRVQ